MHLWCIGPVDVAHGAIVDCRVYHHVLSLFAAPSRSFLLRPCFSFMLVFGCCWAVGEVARCASRRAWGSRAQRSCSLGRRLSAQGSNTKWESRKRFPTVVPFLWKRICPSFREVGVPCVVVPPFLAPRPTLSGCLWPGLSPRFVNRREKDRSCTRLTTRVAPESHTSGGVELQVWRKFPPGSGAVVHRDAFSQVVKSSNSFTFNLSERFWAS